MTAMGEELAKDWQKNFEVDPVRWTGNGAS
jgi:hypothetical protein